MALNVRLLFIFGHHLLNTHVAESREQRDKTGFYKSIFNAVKAGATAGQLGTLPPPPTRPVSSFLLGLHQPFLHEAAVQLLDVGVYALGVGHCQPHHVIYLQQLGTVRQFPEGWVR